MAFSGAVAYRRSDPQMDLLLLRFTEYDTEQRFWNVPETTRAILNFDRTVTCFVLFNNILLLHAVKKYYGDGFFASAAALSMGVVIMQCAAWIAMRHGNGAVYYRHRTAIMAMHRLARIAVKCYLAVEMAKRLDVDESAVLAAVGQSITGSEKIGGDVFSGVAMIVRLLVMRSFCILSVVHALQFFLPFRFQVILQTIAAATSLQLNTNAALVSLQHPGLRPLVCSAVKGLSLLSAVPLGVAPAGAAGDCPAESVAVLNWVVRYSSLTLCHVPFMCTCLRHGGFC